MIAERGISISQACRVVAIDRKVYRYQSRKKCGNEAIKKQLAALSLQYPRYGFKKLYGLLRHDYPDVNHKRIYRLYKELKLNIKRRAKKRLAPRTAKALEQPHALNVCWSLDYMSDALIGGRRFRTLNVLDDCNREAVGILASISLPATRVTRYLDQVAITRGYPKRIRVDNGPENISGHFQRWANEHGIEILYIQPGKPAQNAYIERFNRSYREAILDMYLFTSIHQVQKLTNEWINHYNVRRPHEALNNLSPLTFAKQLKTYNSISALG